MTKTESKTNTADDKRARVEMLLAALGATPQRVALALCRAGYGDYMDVLTAVWAYVADNGHETGQGNLEDALTPPIKSLIEAHATHRGTLGAWLWHQGLVL